MEIKNARIDGTFLGMEDHGIFTCWLYLDYGSSSQGFGGYFLESKPDMIQKILAVVGVDSWEKLSGKYIRVEYDYQKISRIGHITKDVWYNPSEEK